MRILLVILLLWQVTAFAQTGIFMTATGGWAQQVGLPNQTTAGADKIAKEQFPAARFGVGYIHDLSKRIGVGMDVAYGTYGRSTYYLNNNAQRVKVDSDTMEFMFVMMGYLDRAGIYAELGGIRNTMRTKSGNNTDSETKIQPEILVGANYRLWPHLALTLSYLHAFGQKINSVTDTQWRAPGLNAVLAGIRVYFF